MLWKIFVEYGRVGEVFIPNKVDKWGKCFGFVKLEEVVKAEEMEGRLQDVRCGKEVLKVNLARFGRDEGVKNPKTSRDPVKEAYAVEGPRGKVMTRISFKDVMAREEASKRIPAGTVEKVVADPTSVHERLERYQGDEDGRMCCVVIYLGGGVIEKARSEKKEWWTINFVKV